jgi:hypothetical protein
MLGTGQRLIARGDEHSHRPGARVAGEREERKRMEICQYLRATGHHPGVGAEVPRVIESSASSIGRRRPASSVYYGDWEHRVTEKILARKFYFAGPPSQIDRAAAPVTARQRFRPASASIFLRIRT